MSSARQLKKTLQELFESQPDDERLRDHLEGVTRDENFSGLTWFWGPILYARNKARFRALIFNRFSDWEIVRKRWRHVRWSDHERDLQSWLEAARSARDTQLVRRLLRWKHAGKRWGVDLRSWNTALTTDYLNATGPAARATVLDEYDDWFDLDELTALALYECDVNSGRFILRHLPRGFWGDEKRRRWTRLSSAIQARGDEALYFELYRKQVSVKEWRADVLGLATSLSDPATLLAELDRRHPDGHGLKLGDAFVALLESRGREVMPYIRQKLRDGLGTWYGEHARPFIKIAERESWWDLWSATIRTSRNPKLFNGAVGGLLDNEKLTDADRRARLASLAGVSGEWNWGGFGFAQVHSLDDALAVRLYERHPDLVRGPFKPNITPTWWHGFPQLLQAAQAAGDHDLVDLLASRYATQARHEHTYFASKDHGKVVDTADQLGVYYRAIRDRDPVQFARRAANVLTRIPANSIFSYNRLLRTNQLARLLFVRSFDTYLAAPEGVVDLVEGSEIHVQMLAYRILAQDDERASRLAVETFDIVQGTLLRPLHRKTRLAAFGALVNAARADASVAERLLVRAHAALRLPDTRYPKEELIRMIAQILVAQPVLRRAGETPVVYGLEEVVV